MLEGSNTRLEPALHPHIIATSPAMPGTGREMQTRNRNHTTSKQGVCACPTLSCWAFDQVRVPTNLHSQIPYPCRTLSRAFESKGLPSSSFRTLRLTGTTIHPQAQSTQTERYETETVRARAPGWTPTPRQVSSRIMRVTQPLNKIKHHRNNTTKAQASSLDTAGLYHAHVTSAYRMWS